MPDLRERFRSLDSLEVPDIMARAHEMGPSVPAPEPAFLARRVAAIAIAAAFAAVAILLAVQVLPQERVPADEPPRPPAIPSPTPSWDPCYDPPCVHVGNVDATITLMGSSCELGGVDGPIGPGTLRLELVNDAHSLAFFKIVRLTGGRMLDRLRADPGRPTGRLGYIVRSSKTRTWSSVRRHASSRWAVICWRDQVEGRGWLFAPVGVAGPIEIR